jgi:hypothetical protein
MTAKRKVEILKQVYREIGGNDCLCGKIFATLTCNETKTYHHFDWIKKIQKNFGMLKYKPLKILKPIDFWFLTNLEGLRKRKAIIKKLIKDWESKCQ